MKWARCLKNSLAFTKLLGNSSIKTPVMMARGSEFDGAVLCEDMGYRGGLLFSPTLYRKLVMPSDRKLCEFFKSRGMKVMVHSYRLKVSLIVPHDTFRNPIKFRNTL